MKDTYSDEIMLCFVQGFSNGNSCDKSPEYRKSEENTYANHRDGVIKRKPSRHLSVPEPVLDEEDEEESEFTYKRKLFLRKSVRAIKLSSAEKILPEVKRSFSDRFAVVSDTNGKIPKKLLTIRKTWSTGNFASGAGGGGGGGARSAPATPLQLEPQPRHGRHDKHVVKPLSSLTATARGPAPAAGDASDASESGKAPSKARQKKFLRHFPQVPPEERVLNYYSCALVGDILLQGHLYITKNYFAFYSNVFGYVTKLLIPTVTVIRVSKEKLARIIPNAISVCTREERHVFGSLLSRDTTYKLMTRVWKGARVERPPPEPTALHISECELDASEYSPEDESSSGGGGGGSERRLRRTADVLQPGPAAAVIQPQLLTRPPPATPACPAAAPAPRLLLLLAAILSICAAVLAARLLLVQYYWTEVGGVGGGIGSGDEGMSWLVSSRRAELAGRAAADLDAFLSANLLLLSKVRQSLQTLSDVLMQEIPDLPNSIDSPNDTAYS